MPIALRDRLRPDSIAEFRRAAAERFLDGEAAAAAARRTAAIYLWGYAAEMTIKAAYFSLIGHRAAQTITRQDLDGAKAIAIKTHKVSWSHPGNLHNVAAWAELLVTVRSLSPQSSYSSPAFGPEVQNCCRTVSKLWSEQLRYHKNVAYRHEVHRMRATVVWLLDRSSQL